MSTFHTRDNQSTLAVGAAGIAVRKRVPFSAAAKWHAGFLHLLGHVYAVQFGTPTAALRREGLGLLVRPAHATAVKACHSAPFEEFFGFGCHCSGYTWTTVTGVFRQNVKGL
jgi:hypothetical protein